MTTTTEFPRSPVAYMTAVERELKRELGRSITTLEAGEIYGAWQKAVPMDEIVAKIKERAKCVTGCGSDAVRNKFCDEHASEIEQDIDFQDCAPVQSRGAAADARVRQDDARIRQSGSGE